jgi:anti-sigma regulatory factor (Ser/Thr protein kinase)
MLDGLARALKALRAGAAALRAENASLRADNARLRLRPGAERAEGMESRVVRLPLDARAPAAARAAVAECLSGHVEPAVLDAAQLLASELVTNSLRHSGAADGEAVVLDVELRPRGVRIEVEDPGRDGAIVPRRPDLDHGGGIGLLLVQAMSERWGFERVTAGGTRVWAQIASTPVLGRSTR